MQKTHVVTTVRALCEYKVLTDVPGDEVVTEFLAAATDYDVIEDYKVLTSIAGAFGLQLVAFTLDVDLNAEQLDNPKLAIKGIVDKIIADADVEVRWIGLI